MNNIIKIKAILRIVGIIAVTAVIGFTTTACDLLADTELSGVITISPTGPVTINTELTATYSGTETVTFQWKKDGSNVGTASTTNPNTFTPTQAGSYTVTVSADSYTPKTSAAVTVTDTGVNVFTSAAELRAWLD
ncbi:hypothetical protein, partial [Treponema sp. R80B11-R83G3]